MTSAVHEHTEHTRHRHRALRRASATVGGAPELARRRLSFGAVAGAQDIEALASEHAAPNQEPICIVCMRTAAAAAMQCVGPRAPGAQRRRAVSALCTACADAMGLSAAPSARARAANSAAAACAAATHTPPQTRARMALPPVGPSAKHGQKGGATAAAVAAADARVVLPPIRRRQPAAEIIARTRQAIPSLD